MVVLWMSGWAMAAPIPPVCDVAAEKGIRAGADGWLFIGPELNAGAIPGADVAAGMGALVQALAHSTPKVIAVVLPSRALVTPASRGIADYPRTRAEQSHAGLVEFIRHHGLETIDALPAGREMVAPDLFFRMRDIHLSHAGARRLTGLVAQAARAWSGFSTLPKVTFSSTPIGLAPFANEAVSTLIQQHCGTAAPESEVTNRWSTKRDREIGLLDEDVAPKVAWWGTSNAAALSNLPGFIEDALDTPVETLGTKGGGLLGSLYTAVRDPAWKTNPPALVIWEISAAEYWREVDGAPNPQDPAVYDEIVPAVWGSCPDSSALALGDWTLNAELLSWHATATPSYLFIEAERPDVSQVMIEVGHHTHRYEDYSRTVANGRYFWRLPAGTGPMKLGATWTSDEPIRLRARVCAAPK